MRTLMCHAEDCAASIEDRVRQMSKLLFVASILHWPPEVCQIRSFIADETPESVVYYALSSSSSAFASLRSAVSKPSVNRP